jgi:hypothetical protein
MGGMGECEQHRQRSPHIMRKNTALSPPSYLQLVHLLPINIDSRFVYNATQPRHLSPLFHLYIELQFFKEVITMHPNRIFWHVMCHQRCRFRRLTIDVCCVDRPFYAALADLA